MAACTHLQDLVAPFPHLDCCCHDAHAFTGSWTTSMTLANARHDGGAPQARQTPECGKHIVYVEQFQHMLCDTVLYTDIAAATMETTYRPPQGIITEVELFQAPLEDCHRELAVMHFQRLTRVLTAEDEDAIGRYTNKEAAREQLARLTLVVRDYMAERAKGNIEDVAIESMITDVVDASFFKSGKQGTFSQPAFANPLFFGREHEIAALMQEVSAGNVDDVIELWNAPPTAYNKVLPEHGPGWDIGSAIDWNRVLGRSRSEDDITHHFKHTKLGYPVKVERNQKKLMKRVESHISLLWPPAADEVCVTASSGRSRADTGVSMSSTWS